jgi:hypothetical protein
MDAADPDEIWTGRYSTDGIDNDNDGQGSPNNDDPDEVHWQPLFDKQLSMSIADLALDPSDPSGNTLFAGVGRTSSLGDNGGIPSGVLMVTNASRPTSAGGVTIQRVGVQAGQDVSSLDGRNVGGLAAGTAGADKVLIVAANGYGVSRTNRGLAGLYRIVKPGIAGEQVTYLSGTGNIPKGPVYDVVVDPSNTQRFYAAIGGDDTARTKGGLFRSDNGGATWTKIGDNPITNRGLFAVATRPPEKPNATISERTAMMEMAIHSGGRLYVAIVNDNVTDCNGANPDARLAAVYWTSDQGANWQAMDLPTTMQGPCALGIHDGGQGETHLSLAVDPDNANLLFIGGDAQPVVPFTGRLFRGDTNTNPTGVPPSAPLNGSRSRTRKRPASLRARTPAPRPTPTHGK